MIPPPDDALAQRLRTALAETADLRPVGPPPVLTEDGGRSTAPARHPRAVRVAWIAAPVAMAAAVAAAVVLPDGPAHPATPPDAAGSPGATRTTEVGLVPAALLTPGSTVPMKPGQYRYERTTSKTMTSATEGFIDVFESWVPQDPTQEWTLRTTYEDLQGRAQGEPGVETARCGAFMDPSRNVDRAAFETRVCAEISTAVRPTAQYIVQLPTDPTALYDRLNKDGVEVLLPALGVPAAGDESFFVWQLAVRLAQDATGLSQPFSAALEKAIAMMPGVTVRHDLTNLKGVGGTTYEPPPYPGADLGAMTFDAEGNYIGAPDTSIEVGAADAPLAVPAHLTG